MVKSGLEDRVSVAPERLATHLGLALILFCRPDLDGAGGLGRAGQARTRPTAAGRARPAALFSAGVFVQCLLGALVAGNQAGLIDNDWPLMDGRLVPADYWQGGALGDAGPQPAACSSTTAWSPTRAARRGRRSPCRPAACAPRPGRRAAALAPGGGVVLLLQAVLASRPCWPRAAGVWP